MCNRIFSGPQGLQPTDSWSRQSRRHGRNASRGHVLGTVLLLLLLCAPAWAADPGTVTSLSASGTTQCAAGSCALGNYPVSTTSGAIHASVTVRASTAPSADTAETLACTLGGQTTSFKSTRSLNSATKSFQFLWLSDKLAAMGDPGDKALVCAMTGETPTSSTGVMASVRHFQGVVQEVPTIQDGNNSGTTTTLSAGLTSVVAGSIVCWVTEHGADPGTWVSPTTDSSATLVSRFQRTACVVSVAGGTVGVDPTWTNSVLSGAVAVAFAPAPEASVKPPVIAVIQPFPFVPPAATLTITNDATLSNATEGQAYAEPFTGTGGTDPRTFRISEGGSGDAQ